MKKRAIVSVLVLSMILGMLPASYSQAAYKVNKYGELYSYSGSENVVIQANTSAIASYIFEKTKIKSFSVVPRNPYFKTVNGVLMSKDGSLLLRCPTEKSGSYTIPSTVRKITEGAFSNCKKLTSVYMPDSVTSVGSYMFSGCRNLASVRLSQNIKSIPSHMFYKCKKLKSISLPQGIDFIGSYGFANCEKLTKVVVPSSVTSLDSGVFSECENLKVVELSKKIESIPNQLFDMCENLVTVTGRENVTNIGYSAYYGCAKLKDACITSKVMTIGGNAFNGCAQIGNIHFAKDIEYIASTAFVGAAKSFTIESGSSDYSTSKGVLYNDEMTKLIQAPAKATGSLVIPSTVKKISNKAFIDSSYSGITIPEGIKTFNIGSISGSSKLVSLSLPASITAIKDWFWGNDYKLNRLTKIEVKPSNKSFVSIQGAVYTANRKEMVFFPTGRHGKFVIPDECKNLCSMIHDNKISEFSVSSKNKYFTSFKGVLYNKKIKAIKAFPMIKHTYKVPATVVSLSYLSDHKTKLRLKSYTVEKGNENFFAKKGVLYTQGSNVLYDYPTYKAGAYKSPSFVSYFKSSAFENAKKLTKLTVTKNIRRGSYDTWNFYNCSKLKEINVKQGNITKLNVQFEDCNKFKKLVLPSTIMAIEGYGLTKDSKIYGWDNTGASSLAESCECTYIRRGVVPNKVTGFKAKKIIDRYQLSWNMNSEATGYQIMTDSGVIKTIKGARNTSVFISNRYRDEIVYIRAYKVNGKKKAYGKAKSIYIGG